MRPDQLPAKLARGLAPIYLIAGNEPLLVQECRDQVIRAAQAQGYSERQVYDVARSFDWARLGEEAAAPSLFAARRILDVRLPTGKPGNDGARALGERAASPDPDLLLIVSSGEWSGAMRKLKWVTALAGAGELVEIWPIKPEELPGWIRQRMAAAGLDPEPSAVALLTELVEGNLLAAQQEIDKLLLLGQSGRVTAADVSRSVANSARFDCWRLVDCALQGDLAECLRVAAGLQRTGVAIQIVVGALSRELGIADAVGSAVRAGESESAAFGRMRVWPARQALIRKALRRVSPAQFGEAFQALSLIDRQGKGRASGEPWETLDRLLWMLCDPQTVFTT